MNLDAHFGLLPELAFRPIGGRMTLEGGGGGSSSSSSSSSSQTTNQIDRRMVVDGGGIGINADGSVISISQTTTDFGAIESARQQVMRALALVEASDQQSGKTLSEALGFAKDVFDSGISVLDKAGEQINDQAELIAKAYDNAKGEATQKNLIAAASLAAVAIVAVKVMGR